VRGTTQKLRLAGLLPAAPAVIVLLAALCCAGCGSTAADTLSTVGSERPVTPASSETAAAGQTLAPGETPAAGASSAAGVEGSANASGGSSGPTPAATSAAALGSVQRAREPYQGDGTKAKGQYARGTVVGSDGKPVAGATVTVVINAADPLYKTDDGRLVGKATTDAAGAYKVSLAALPRGTIVDVSAVKRGYTSVLVYGKYDERVEEIDFKDFGSKSGDRRLPLGDQMPPMPFEDLLPD
jgi:hypothetical protein